MGLQQVSRTTPRPARRRRTFLLCPPQLSTLHPTHPGIPVALLQQLQNLPQRPMRNARPLLRPNGNANGDMRAVTFTSRSKQRDMFDVRYNLQSYFQICALLQYLSASVSPLILFGCLCNLNAEMLSLCKGYLRNSDILYVIITVFHCERMSRDCTGQSMVV